MSVEKGLLQLIKSDSGVTASGVTGVYWILAPKQNVLPFIVLDRVATSDTIAMSGDQAFRGTLFQVSCFAGDYYGSRAVALAVRSLLKNYRGNLPDTDATAVNAVFQTKDWDLSYEEGSVGFVYHAMQEFRFWYYDNAVSVPPSSAPPAVVDGGPF